MRYAILSDLHANRQALKAVLTDIQSIGVDQLICLGDCVGYGPSPAEVLEIAYTRIHHFILGNHDAVIAGRLDPGCFNDNAREVIDWTVGALDRASGDFFNELPLVIRGDEGFACAHGDFSTPGAFNYIFAPDEALPSFSATPEPVLFTGHSHVPGLFVLGGSGVPHWLEPLDFGLEQGKRYLINVGSVGQPRDRDIRASYVVFDHDAGNVFFRKVPFDIDAYRHDLQRRQVPEKASYFLSLDSSRESRPLRELVNFRPARNHEFRNREHDVQNLAASLRKLKKNNRYLLLWAILSALMTMTAVWVAFNWRSAAADASLSIPALIETVSAAGNRVGDKLLSMPAVPASAEQGEWEISGRRPLRHWNVVLDDPEAQKVYVSRHDDEVHFRLVSNNPAAKITLSSAAVPLRQGQRIQVRATFYNQAVESGYAEIYSQFRGSDGTFRRMEASTVHNLAQLTRWSPRRATCGALREDGQARLVIQAQFQGELRVRDGAMILR